MSCSGHCLDRLDQSARKGQGKDHNEEDHSRGSQRQGKPLLREEPNLYRMQKVL